MYVILLTWCDKTGVFQKRWNVCNYSHKRQGYDINSYFILSVIHWLCTVEIMNAYFLLAFKLLFSVNRIMSHSSKFLPFKTAITALVYKWRTVLVTHREMVSFPNVAEPLFPDIKVGHTIQPTTLVKRKQAGTLAWVCCPLVLHLQSDLPRWMFVSLDQLT